MWSSGERPPGGFWIKKSGILFRAVENFVSLQPQNRNESAIGLWCNGNTTDSGPVIPGSNPGSPTHPPLFKSLNPAGNCHFTGFFVAFPDPGPAFGADGGKPVLLFMCPGGQPSFRMFSSMSLIFSLTSSMSPFSFSTLCSISVSRLLPFLEVADRKPRLFS